MRLRMPKRRTGAPKKARKLGKWRTGYDGHLNPKYAEKRRKRRKAARRARSVNHRRAKA